MEIKVWDIVRGEYVEDNLVLEDLFLNLSNTIGTFESKYFVQETRHDLEPHFYLNGERVA